MSDIYHHHKGSYSGNVQQLKEHAGFISSKTTYAENYHTEFHFHENPHLSFILQGGNLEYKKNNICIRNKGEVLFYRSGELHKTIPTNEATKNLNFEIENSFLVENLLSEDVLGYAISDNISSQFFMLKMYRELQLDDTTTDTAIQMLLLDFIKSSGKNRLEKKQWCIQLKELLNDEWNKNHSLAELSLLLGVHPVNISKYFHRYFGCTYGEYVRKLKISNSLSLIKNGSTSLTEIALLCGFADQSHFTRVFKACTGINPKYFQKL